ncbi:unnamed protein product [Allacma fusca]|uniref:Uncharacterized protein n=1 Tax=Allacma fusca TaxID=39272 RepID=A0A8J2JQT6_9HEXA|nr:unnamed protein product [Allacma fusca]
MGDQRRGDEDNLPATNTNADSIFDGLDIWLTDLETNEAKINTAVRELLINGPQTNVFHWDFSPLNLPPEGEIRHLARIVQSLDTRVLKNRFRIWGDNMILMVAITLASFYIVAQFGAL